MARAGYIDCRHHSGRTPRELKVKVALLEFVSLFNWAKSRDKQLRLLAWSLPDPFGVYRSPVHRLQEYNMSTWNLTRSASSVEVAKTEGSPLISSKVRNSNLK